MVRPTRQSRFITLQLGSFRPLEPPVPVLTDNKRLYKKCTLLPFLLTGQDSSLLKNTEWQVWAGLT